MEKQWDCVVCGSCTADILVGPLDLDSPLGEGVLHRVDPIEVTSGGLAANAGIAMSRMGLRVSMLSRCGEDYWASIMRQRFECERIDISRLQADAQLPSSSTVVMVDATGGRSFAHHQGAPQRINREFIMQNIDLIGDAKMFLIGYYSLLPNLQDDLPDVFAEIRRRGCRTAMDAAGSGGTMTPLDRILPHLDIYVPSLAEALHQTGKSDPRAIIETYRNCGAPGVLGVKLGAQGALLQDADGTFVEIAAVTPPGEVVDTTGAGDSFYAGLIAGLSHALPLADAGRVAAAAGACCVTARGASTAIVDYPAMCRLAGLDQRDHVAPRRSTQTP